MRSSISGLRTWLRIGAVILAASWTVSSPLPAQGGASDFETLTIDLLFGPEGLHAIDAAVVESSGPTYEAAPTVELREEVARNLLDALRLSEEPVEIDLENSERYHRVGFTIRFEDPTLGGLGVLAGDTSGLQQTARDAGLPRLKLSICRGYSSSGIDPRDVELGASSPIGIGCESWVLATGDEPLSMEVRIQGELPTTGLPLASLTVLAIGLLATGLILALPDLFTGSAMRWSRPLRLPTRL